MSQAKRLQGGDGCFDVALEGVASAHLKVEQNAKSVSEGGHD